MIAVELGGWLAASAAGFAAARVWRAAALANGDRRPGLPRAARTADRGAAGTPARRRVRASSRRHGCARSTSSSAAPRSRSMISTAVRTRRTWWRPPEPVDLEQLVSDSVEAWRPAAAARGVELRAFWIGRSRDVWGDRLRLAQALGNLISNAIEHGGGVVEVRGRSDAGGVRVEVTDHGPGLPAPIGELARRPRAGPGGCGARAGDRVGDCVEPRRSAGGGAVAAGRPAGARAAGWPCRAPPGRRWDWPTVVWGVAELPSAPVTRDGAGCGRGVRSGTVSCGLKVPHAVAVPRC